MRQLRSKISDKRRFEVIGISDVHCRLDYCNALLAGITDTQIKRLQSVQNTAARLVSEARRRDHITPVLHSTGFRCGEGSFSRLQSSYGNVSTASHLHICNNSAYGQSSRTSSTAVGINWMCRPAKSTDVGGPAQLRLPRVHSVEQSAISTA